MYTHTEQCTNMVCSCNTRTHMQMNMTLRSRMHTHTCSDLKTHCPRTSTYTTLLHYPILFTFKLPYKIIRFLVRFGWTCGTSPPRAPYRSLFFCLQLTRGGQFFLPTPMKKPPGGRQISRPPPVHLEKS